MCHRLINAQELMKRLRTVPYTYIHICAYSYINLYIYSIYIHICMHMYIPIYIYHYLVNNSELIKHPRTVSHNASSTHEPYHTAPTNRILQYIQHPRTVSYNAPSTHEPYPTMHTYMCIFIYTYIQYVTHIHVHVCIYMYIYTCITP